MYISELNPEKCTFCLTSIASQYYGSGFNKTYMCEICYERIKNMQGSHIGESTYTIDDAFCSACGITAKIAICSDNYKVLLRLCDLCEGYLAVAIAEHLFHKEGLPIPVEGELTDATS